MSRVGIVMKHLFRHFLDAVFNDAQKSILILVVCLCSLTNKFLCAGVRRPSTAKKQLIFSLKHFPTKKIRKLIIDNSWTPIHKCIQ